jgi:hypothetical protein
MGVPITLEDLNAQVTFIHSIARNAPLGPFRFGVNGATRGFIPNTGCPGEVFEDEVRLAVAQVLSEAAYVVRSPPR